MEVMSKENFEKARIVFQESKDRLQSSKINYEELENKISRFSTLCIALIGVLAITLSFLSMIFFKISLLVLICGFIHSLFNLLYLNKTNTLASLGIGARAVIDHNDYKAKDSSSLLRSLAKTYEDKADYNNSISKQKAEVFDKTIANISKYFVVSAIALVIGIMI